MFELLIRWGAAFAIAYLLGKLVARFRLPSVLGWLIAGMLLGPYALNVGTVELMEASWYTTSLIFIEFIVGSIVGTEIIWKAIKKSGKSLIGITLGESLGTFFTVTLLFGIIFYLTDIPVFMAFIFGGIALATAPVPSLSIVKEYNAKGPVSNALAIIAALDDVVATAIFFLIIAIVAGTVVSAGMPFYMIPVILIAPIFISMITGFIASWLMNKTENKAKILDLFAIFFIITTLIGMYVNSIMTYGSINYLLMGMAFSATIANLIPMMKLNNLIVNFNPVFDIAFVLFILNLGFPLDYRLIMGAGIYSLVYMISRAFGKYFGTYVSAKKLKASDTVKKYLGFTLLPHSGVSLAFTSIAASMLSPVYPELSALIIGTISSAAIINEIFAVIIAKKAFVLAGEIDDGKREVIEENL